MSLSLDHLNALRDFVLEKVRGALCESGTMVGCLASQSVGEPMTQMNLNAFHLCLSKVTGVTRAKELIDASKNMQAPCVTAVLHPSLRSSTSFLADVLPCVMLGDVVVDTVLKPEGAALSEFADVARQRQEVHGMVPSQHGFSITLSRKKLRASKLTLVDVVRQLRAYCGDVLVVDQTPDAYPVWNVVLRLASDAVPADSVEIIPQVLSELCQHLCNRVQIGGMEGVRSCEMRSIDYHEQGKQRRMEVLDVHGSVFEPMTSLMGIDCFRTVSNNVFEINHCLGIEAANACLLQQLHECMSDDGTYINIRHLSTIVDIMTYSGAIVPISRHGVNQTSDQPLQRCSFEETFEVATDAALFGLVDKMSGITANMMFGKCPPIGTNYSELMFMPSTDTMGRRDLERNLKRRRKFDRPKPPPSMEWRPEPISQSKFYESTDVVEPTGSFQPTSDVSPFLTEQESSAGHTPGSPGYTPESPGYTPESPDYTPDSPGYAPDSPGYAPDSPGSTGGANASDLFADTRTPIPASLSLDEKTDASNVFSSTKVESAYRQLGPRFLFKQPSVADMVEK